MTNLSKFTQTSIIIVIIMAGLIYGKTFLIPLIFAFIFWVLIRKLKELLNRISGIKKYVPNWIKNIILTVIIFYLLYFIGTITSSNIAKMGENYDLYEANFSSLVIKVNQTFGIDLAHILEQRNASALLGNLIQPMVTALTSMLGNIFMVALYMMFLFLEETNFNSKLKLIFNSEEKYAKVSKALGELEFSISNYLGLKTLVSLITGIFSAIALAIIGVDAPVFWGLVIFLLNYIPTIGSLIATVFPVVFCLLQFPDLTPAIITLVVVGTIQLVVGNFIEPKLLGSSLNLSALITILALSLWGIIWGVTGMILSVPITVIMVIIFAKFEQTKSIAIMLSDKGNV